MNKEEILAMEVGYNLDTLMAIEIFGVAKTKRYIKCYSANSSYGGEIIKQLLKDGLIHNFTRLLEEISPKRTFPEAICKAALLAKL